MRASHVLALLVLAAPLSGGVTGDPAPPGRAQHILLEAAAAGDHDIDRLATRLGSLPSTEVPELFEILASGEVAAPELSRPVPLDAVLRAGLVESFGRHSPVAVRAVLAEVRGEHLSAETRAAALAVLGEMGSAEDVGTILRIAAPTLPEDAVSRAARSQATDALARTIARDPRAVWRLRSAYDEAPPGLMGSIPSAIGIARPPEGLQVLTELLGASAEMDPLVLAEIGRFAESVGGRIDPAVLGTVRDHLGSRDPRILRGAALAVRQLDDTRAALDLVRLLRHSDPNVRAGCDLALQRIAGRDLRGDPDRWEQWYGEEQVWREDRGPTCLADLASGDRAFTAAALNEIARHRLFRHEFDGAVARVLETGDPGLVVLACGVVGKLGGREALPVLLVLRESPDPTLSAAAEGALRAVLGPAHSPTRTVVQR